jgi:serine/threonine protein kinase
VGSTVLNQANLSTSTAQALVRYEKHLSAASIGSIWLGRLLNGSDAGRVVVLRRIAKQWLSNKDAEWVLYGADAYSKVRHPSLLKLLGALDQGNDLVTVSEHLEGVRLVELQRSVFDEGVPIPATVAVRLVLDAARATCKAHRLAADVGIFPTERLFLPEGAYVTGYGATLLGELGVLSALAKCVIPRTVPDLLAQLAPEELGARSAQAGSPEVFSLGVVLWELLANRWLFSRDSDSRTHQELLLSPIRSLDQIERFGMPVPESLVRLVRKATERDPTQRFSSVNDLILALERLPAHFVATEQQVSEVLRQRVAALLKESRGDESERALSGTFAEVRSSQPSIASSSVSSHDWDRPTFAQSSLVSRPPYDCSVTPFTTTQTPPSSAPRTVVSTNALLSITLTMLAVGAFVLTFRGLSPNPRLATTLAPAPAARVAPAAALPQVSQIQAPAQAASIEALEARAPEPIASALPTPEQPLSASASPPEGIAPVTPTKRTNTARRPAVQRKTTATQPAKPEPENPLTGTSIDPQWGI